MPVIRATDAPHFSLPGVEFVAYAAPSRGSAQLCTWQVTVEPGTDSIPHTLDSDETFLVLDGTIRLSPDGPTLAAGDVAVVPAGEQIRLVNAGSVPAKAYVAIRAGFTATTTTGEEIRPPWAV